jgi:hypothetical protein
MKRRLISVLLFSALLSLVCTNLTTNVLAENAPSSTSLEVYVQQGNSGTPEFVHIYSQTEMEALAESDIQYYTGIDSMPSVLQGKGIGVLLSSLINDLKYYNEGVSFGSGAQIKTNAPDGYSVTYTYEYLFGETRYCYPNFTDIDNPNTDGAIAIEPMLCIISCQTRNRTTTELDSFTMDASESYRFCYGLLPSDVSNLTCNVNKFGKWINQLYIILPAENGTFTTSQAAEVTPSNNFNIWLLIVVVAIVCLIVLVIVYKVIMRQQP